MAATAETGSRYKPEKEREAGTGSGRRWSQQFGRQTRVRNATKRNSLQRLGEFEWAQALSSQPFDGEDLRQGVAAETFCLTPEVSPPTAEP